MHVRCQQVRHHLCASEWQPCNQPPKKLMIIDNFAHGYHINDNIHVERNKVTAAQIVCLIKPPQKKFGGLVARVCRYNPI